MALAFYREVLLAERDQQGCDGRWPRMGRLDIQSRTGTPVTELEYVCTRELHGLGPMKKGGTAI